MISTCKNFLRRFGARTDGSTSVEAVIVYPALMVIFAASWVFFDVLRQQSVSQKANYTIGDMISRETEKLDAAYISNAQQLLWHLTKSHGDDVDLRVTVIQFDGEDGSETGIHEVIWSEARGDWSALTDGDMSGYDDRLPLMADADQLILVETRDAYDPTFAISGIGPFDIETYSFTRPRFASQVIFEGVNDGTGADGPVDGEDEPNQDGSSPST